MSMQHQHSLAEDLAVSLIDQTAPGTGALGPHLLTNQGEDQLWDRLRAALRSCHSFTFAVAFISEAMVSNLKPLLRNLAQKGVSGRLLTATYLDFNSPKAFGELLKIPNLTVRISSAAGFHEKGYLFDHGDFQTAIVGSANLTEAALMRGGNQEWALQVSSLNQGQLLDEVRTSFESQWRSARALTPEWIDHYRKTRVPPKSAQAPAHHHVFVANQMQQAASRELAALRAARVPRALVVAATGTGKTSLAAMDARAAHPGRLLFVAHREQILKAALKTFRRFLRGPASDYGLYTGHQHNPTARYVFATVQSLTRPERPPFAPEDFDYLVIDEVHHAGATSYQQLLAYFHPAFTLGLTATPERRDGINVFKLFDYRVAYELRLQQALEDDLLCPFHYVGLSDYQFEDAAAGRAVDHYRTQMADGRAHRIAKRTVALLSSRERVAYILEQTAYYGYSGDRVRGLIFCASVAEARALARELTTQGHPATAIAAATPLAQRERLVARLARGDLEYLVTVDVFNEGIDIPAVNQVVMLRSTSSVMVYLQQLGRGLRKAPGKDFVTVLDFIGNYRQNYLIPLALTGDDSYSKDQAQLTLREEPTIGRATIAFERVAKERIFAALKPTRLDGLANLRRAYQALKDRRSRIPLLRDFQLAGTVDPQILVSAGAVKHYGQFLQRMGERVDLTAEEDRWLAFLSTELVNGKRRHELLLLAALEGQPTLTVAAFKKSLVAAHCLTDPATMRSVERVLDLSFYAERAAPTRSDYGGQPIVSREGARYRLNPAIQAALARPGWFRRLWFDAIAAGLVRAERYQPGQMMTIGERYTRKDAVRLINNPQNLNAQIVSGYYFTNVESGLHEAIIFVTAEKRAKLRAAINYQNGFVNPRVLSYFMKQGDAHFGAKNLRRFQSGDYRLHLFMQRSATADRKNYYYLGTCHYRAGSAELVKDGRLTRMKILLELDATPGSQLQAALLAPEEDR